MRKHFGIAYAYITVALVLFSGYGESSVVESGQLLFSERTYTFGTARQGDTITHTFVIKNVGAAPVKIARMELSQLGMTARVTPMIPPGQEGKLTVKWDTKQVKGELSGDVLLHLDDPAQSPIRIALIGIIKPPLEFLPSRAVFLNVFKGESGESTVTIVNNEARPLAITRLEPRGQHFVADLRMVESGKIYQIVVKVPPDTAPGRYLEGLEAHTDRPDREPIRIAVNVRVKEDLYTFPDLIDFGRVSLAQLSKTPSVLNLLTQTVLVKKRHGEFEISSVTSTLPFLRIQQDPSGRSGTFRIDVSLDETALRAGKLDGSLRIKTTDSQLPELVLPVHGELK